MVEEIGSIRLAEFRPSAAALAAVSSGLARLHVFVPLTIAGGKLIVALCEGSPTRGIAATMLARGWSIVVVRAPRRDLEVALDQYYP